MSYNLNVRYKLPASRRKRLALWVMFLLLATGAAYLAIHGLPSGLHLPHHGGTPAKAANPVAN